MWGRGADPRLPRPARGAAPGHRRRAGRAGPQRRDRPRLYKRIRPGFTYAGSLELLARARAWLPEGCATKSNLILGMGEERDEVLQTMADLRSVGVELLTITQYLQPTKAHLNLQRFVPPRSSPTSRPTPRPRVRPRRVRRPGPLQLPRRRDAQGRRPQAARPAPRLGHRRRLTVTRARLAVLVLLAVALVWLGVRAVRAFDQDRHAAEAAAVLSAPDKVTYELVRVSHNRMSGPAGGSPTGPGPGCRWSTWRGSNRTSGIWCSCATGRGGRWPGRPRPGPDGTAQVRRAAEPRPRDDLRGGGHPAVDDATSIPHGQPVLQWFDASLGPPGAPVRLRQGRLSGAVLVNSGETNQQPPRKRGLLASPTSAQL